MQTSKEGQAAAMLKHRSKSVVQSNSMALSSHLIFGTEVCPFVVELLQRIHVLTNDCCVQVCSKLTFPLQATTTVGTC